MSWLVRAPREIHFGEGAVRRVPELVVRHGRRVLLCTDAFLASTAEFVRLRNALVEEGAVVEVFDGTEPELPLSCIDKAARVGRDFEANVLVGYGGGSAIDLAKLVALAIAHPGGIHRFYGEQLVRGPVLPVIAVPTTAGTGSEVTAVAVVGDDRRELKVGISSDRLIPACAVVDPLLTIGCPAGVTAYSGADALCHAIEAFTARTFAHQPEALGSRIFIGKNDQSDRLAVRAIGLIAGAFARVVEEPSDAGARSDMAQGSLLAGLAFGNAGTTAAHALQYPLGALTRTPHGLGVGLLLPYTLATVLAVRAEELAAVAVALGVATESDDRDAAARAAVRAVHQLMATIGIPSSLAEIGVSADQLGRLADQSMTVTRLLGNHAVELDRSAVLGIFEAALHGDNPLTILQGV